MSLEHLPLDVLLYDICKHLNIQEIQVLCYVNKSVHGLLNRMIVNIIKEKLKVSDQELKTIKKEDSFRLYYCVKERLIRLKNNKNKCMHVRSKHGKEGLCLKPTIYKSPMSAYCKKHSTKTFPYEKLFVSADSGAKYVLYGKDWYSMKRNIYLLKDDIIIHWESYEIVSGLYFLV